MNSCIYEGWVRHRRLQPCVHDFRKRLFLMSLDLDELEDVFRGRLLWSTRRLALARFRAEDHPGVYNADQSSETFSSMVRRKLADAGHTVPSGSIQLLTHLRYFGYVFNPLSLFYCRDTSGQVQSVIAEVRNTPWRECHCYVLSRDQFQPGTAWRTAKSFHVSPFMPMDMEYRWMITDPAETLTVSLENWRAGKKCFDVTMQLHRTEISTRSLSRVQLQYPLMTHQVLAGIYWQAFRLWTKGCPFYVHPQKLQPLPEPKA